MAEKKEGFRKNDDETKKILDMSEVSLTLDNYDDIFSDFDPRVYSQRSISHDLLGELKRATREKSEGKLHLTFILPRHERKWESEEVIKARLREHFRKHHIMLADEVKGIKKRGLFMVALGVLMIMIATYIASLELSNFIWHALIIILEPAGWFTSWTGLDEIYYTGRQKRDELVFYEKMANAEVEFLSY